MNHALRFTSVVLFQVFLSVVMIVVVAAVVAVK